LSVVRIPFSVGELSPPFPLSADDQPRGARMYAFSPAVNVIEIRSSKKYFAPSELENHT